MQQGYDDAQWRVYGRLWREPASELVHFINLDAQNLFDKVKRSRTCPRTWLPDSFVRCFNPTAKAAAKAAKSKVFLPIAKRTRAHG